MKKIVAKILKKWAFKLNPEYREPLFPHHAFIAEGYKKEVLSSTIRINEHEWIKTQNRISLRNAGTIDPETIDKICIEEAEKEVKKSIISTIKRLSLIEIYVEKRNDPFGIYVTANLVVGIGGGVISQLSPGPDAKTDTNTQKHYK